MISPTLARKLLICFIVVVSVLAVISVAASKSNSKSDSKSDSDSDSKSDSKSQSAVEDADNGGDWNSDEERDANLVNLWKCYQKKLGRWKKSDNNRDWVAWIKEGEWRKNLAFRIWKALKFGRNWNCEASDNNDDDDNSNDDIDNGCDWPTPEQAKWNLWNLYRCWKIKNKDWKESDENTDWNDFISKKKYKQFWRFLLYKSLKRGRWWKCEVLTTTLVAPTTLPTTLPPTTEKPTTLPPTTEKPTTLPPTTEKPTTLPPTTEKPTTLPPTTEKPTTLPPTTTEAPTTLPPTTTTEKPTTLPPTTTEQPTAAGPQTDPATNAPPTVTAGLTTVGEAQITEKPTPADQPYYWGVDNCAYQLSVPEVEIYCRWKFPGRFGCIKPVCARPRGSNAAWCSESSSTEKTNPTTGTISVEADGFECSTDNECGLSPVTCDGQSQICPNNHHMYAYNQGGDCYSCNGFINNNTALGTEYSVGDSCGSTIGVCNTLTEMPITCLRECPNIPTNTGVISRFIDGHCGSATKQCDYVFNGDTTPMDNGVCPWWIGVYNFHLDGGVQTAAAALRIAKAQSGTTLHEALQVDIAAALRLAKVDVTIASATVSGNSITGTFVTSGYQGNDNTVLAALSSANAFPNTNEVSNIQVSTARVSSTGGKVQQGSESNNNNGDDFAMGACGAGCVGGVIAGIVAVAGVALVIVRRVSVNNNNNAPDAATTTTENSNEQEQEQQNVDHAPNTVTGVIVESAPADFESSGEFSASNSINPLMGPKK